MVEKDSENFYSKYLRISLPFLVLIFLSFSVFALTTTDANYSGGIYNGDFEFAPTYVADTNVSGKWIDGTQTGSTTDKNYGWYLTIIAGSASAKFDSSEKHSGNYSIKLSTLDITGSSYINITSSTSAFTTQNGVNSQFATINIKPSTKYSLSGWIKTNNVNTNAVYLEFAPRKIDGSSDGVGGVTTRITGTTDWTYYSTTFTTGVNTVKGLILLRDSNAGTVGDVWFDDVVLEEVGSVNLSGQSQGRPSIVVTGVSDFNAIDQADTNNSNTMGFGQTTTQAISFQFTPTQNRFSGFVFQRAQDTGTYTGNVTITLEKDNGSDNPDGNILASHYFTNAQWTALTQNVDQKVYLPYVIDANGTNKYHVKFYSDTNDGSNYTRLRVDTGTTYSGGLLRKMTDANVWSSHTSDGYFKTLFEKQSSAFDLNVCSQGDSVCESKTYDIDFLENDENYIITPANAPLFYSGDNNVYFMMHSDSDYNNKTPSMMARLNYTFDKPTTLLTNTPSTEDNKRIITLTCQNATTGNCNQTYYSFNGITYYTYNTPFVLNNGTYNIRYYSTADNNNTETINTSSFTVPIQGSTATCSIAGLFPLLLIAFGITALGGLFFTKQFLDTGDMKYMINFILMLIIGVLIIITIAPILC